MSKLRSETDGEVAELRKELAAALRGEALALRAEAAEVARSSSEVRGNSANGKGSPAGTPFSTEEAGKVPSCTTTLQHALPSSIKDAQELSLSQSTIG
jgi:hypothetical protein